MRHDWYFVAVFADGNVIRFTDLSITKARSYFNGYGDNVDEAIFCQYGRAGEDQSENMWCKGATF